MLCNFLVQTLQCFLKKFKKTFGHKNIKKLTSKVAYLWQLGIFFSAAPTVQQSRIECLFYRFFYPMICGIISGGAHMRVSNSLVQ